MRRRDFIKVIAGAAGAWPLATSAQQGEPMRRVGMLLPYRDGDAEGQAVVTAFQQGLQVLGWTPKS
jgi:predicted hotdog family 3-hydroxylacyl-ACP dehydratase